MSETEFKEFGKIARLNRDIVITEKLDGTNACVVVTEDGQVLSQSRNRFITPEDDNYGFARWVKDNSEALAENLGVGYHYGEWWGAGIQRRYGLVGTDKRFSLFNVARWENIGGVGIRGLSTVPMLYHGPFSQYHIDSVLADLVRSGSYASIGFMDPEGIVIWHEAARQLFKVTIKDDEKPKGSKEK